jgi:16S rRNA (cytosine967-C5)-methyltransferase
MNEQRDGRRSGAPRRGRPAAAYPPRRPRPPAEPADPARRAAFDLLVAVRERDAYANLVLPTLLGERNLTGRDAAFATELGYGTLRAQGTYDRIIDACVQRPPEPAVRDVLRLGTHQLLAMRTPPHAAVSASVALCRAAVGEGPAGFVNAVLRRVGEHDLDGWTARLAPTRDADPAEYLAFRHAHPRWVVNAFAEALRGDWAQTEAVLAADNEPARVSLVARPGRAGRDDLLAAGATPGRWSPLAAVLPGGDPAALPGVRTGAVGVQDEGSQLVTLALANVPLDGPDARWLDTCAGPGGKAALLAGLAAERGARLVAAELAPHRARLVAAALGPDSCAGILGPDSCADASPRHGTNPDGASRDDMNADGAVRAGARATVVVADGTKPAWPDATFDRVLVDAPCTGLGALRRRPEARWRREPGDVGRLFTTQRDLLVRALIATRPGGVVGYVTCSPHVGETKGVVAAARATAERAGVTTDVVPAAVHLPGVPDAADGDCVQLWPHRHGTDAMFLALLRRV